MTLFTFLMLRRTEEWDFEYFYVARMFFSAQSFSFFRLLLTPHFESGSGEEKTTHSLWSTKATQCHASEDENDKLVDPEGKEVPFTPGAHKTKQRLAA